MSKALSNPPKASKLAMNKEIKQRNTIRDLEHMQHLHYAVQHPDDVSNLESMITVPDDEEEMTLMLCLLRKLLPASGKALLKSFVAFGTKRIRGDKDKAEAKSAAKRVRQEVAIRPGMSLPIAYHPCLVELHSNNMHIPLSFFTCPNLETINSNSDSLATLKLNAPRPGEKQSCIINMYTFESKYLRGCDG